MATASPSTKPSHWNCPICEESYNEKDRLPKGFPCQHSVCEQCLEETIKRCDGDTVACPLCRQAVTIPKSKAAGFPNNVAMLDILAIAQSQDEVAPSTCTQHNQVLSVFCSTCQEAVCMTCALKSPQHKGHDMEELAEAIEKCIHQSEELLSDITQTACLVQDDIKQKAQATNPQCLKLLWQLQKCKEYFGNATTGNISMKPYLPTKVSTEDPVGQAPSSAPVLGLPTASLPRPVNKEKLEPLASAKLPEFKCIDINRGNRLLLTFPHSHYATYMVKDHQFCSMEQPALSDKSVRMLKDAQHAILSQDNKLVVQAESSIRMMCHNKSYSFKDRYLCKVHIFGGSWVALSYQCKCAKSGLGFEIIQEKDESTIYEKKDLMLGSLVVPSDAYGGIVVLDKAHGGFSFQSPTCRMKEICISREGSVNIKEPVILRPMPQKMVSAAVMKKILFLLESETTIALYVMKEQTKYNLFCNDHRFGTNSVFGNCHCKVYMDNRMNEIHLQDLGLTTDCKLKKIWAGDAESGTYTLHVLYHQKGQDKLLASYNVNKNFLEKCEDNRDKKFQASAGSGFTFSV